MTYIIYADILLLLNFFLDFFLLWAAGRFLRRRQKLWRLLLAAALGAAYGAAILFPGLSFFYTPWLAIPVSAILLAIAYPWQGWRPFSKLAGVFYIIAFAMAGAVLGASSLLTARGLIATAEWTVKGGTLIFGIFTAIIIARQGVQSLRRAWRREDFLVKLEIGAAGQTVAITALLDTGNDLVEPIGGSPVVVAEYQAIQALLPQGLRQLIGLYDPPTVLQKAAAINLAGWERRLRLVPYASIGRRHGMLLGFRPDKLTVTKGSLRQQALAIICLTERAFAKGEYQAVVNPDIIDINQKMEEVSA